MTETYLITGPSGLAGNHVIRELIDRGVSSENIIGYDLDPRMENIRDVEDEFTLVEGDITDEDTLFETFERHRPTRVIHLAALLVYDAREDPNAVISVNCLGTNNVFEATGEYGVTQCVYASTGGVYGSREDYNGAGDVVVSEDDPVKPSDAYGTSKYMNEVVARNFEDEHDTRYVGVRIGGVWGRGRLFGSTGEFTSFVRDVGLGQSRSVPEAWVDIFGPTGDIYAVYGKDVGRWFVDLVNHDSLTYDVYNQRGSEPFTLTEVASILEEQVPDVTVKVPSDASARTPPPVMDATRWYDELGFTQDWPLDASLVDFVNLHRKREGLSPI